MKIISEAKRKILKELEREPCYGYALSRSLDLPVSYIYQHLRELREAGFITATEKGRTKVYHLTKKGRTLLKALE